MRSLRALLSGVCVLAAATFSNAALVTFNGATTDSTGTGFGQVLSLLVLHDNGNTKDGNQSGAVLWNGTNDVFDTIGGAHLSDTVSAGAVHTQTRTVAEMAGKGINAFNFSLVLNLNEPGNDPQVHLNDFTVYFQNAAGTTLFSATFDSDDLANASTSALAEDGQGNGQGGSGYLFPVVFQNQSELDFFNTPTNRVGMAVHLNESMTGVGAGADSFYVNVPEPTSIGLIGAGMLLALRRKRA